MPSRTAEHKYSDALRAEIFKRDRALCAYSGRSLWLADYGAAPHAVDWVDHIKPVARGGRATVENGVASSHLYNFQKRAGAGSVLLFRGGRPTADFFTFFHVVPPAIAEHLSRFIRLHESDWYFNRALFHVLLGAASKSQIRQDGQPLKRGLDYRANAALKFLEGWAKESNGIPSLARRGLLPKRPGADQKLLLSTATADTVPKLKRLMSSLTPYIEPSWRALEMLSEVQSKAEARALAWQVSHHRHVAHVVKAAVRQNVKALSFDDSQRQH